MSWPIELARWAESLVADEQAIGAVMRRAGYNRERAVEALQRALLSAPGLYARLPAEKRSYGAFRAWMVTKARNLLIDEFRSLRRLQQLGDEEQPAREVDETGAERAAVLREVMAELPADTQQLLWLRSQGYTLQEIADDQGVTPGTIHRRLQEPLKWLRERLVAIDEDLFRAYAQLVKEQ